MNPDDWQSSPEFEAAALAGMAQNEAIPPADRLAMALQALALVEAQRDQFAAALANVAVYTTGREWVSGDEIAALMRGQVRSGGSQ